MPRPPPPEVQAHRAACLPYSRRRLGVRRPGARTAWLLAAAVAWGCGTGPAPTPTEGAAPPLGRDRESWDVRLQMRDATAAVTVEAPYLADDLAAGQTRADSGVTVTLADAAGAVTTRLTAHRLVVDHDTHVVTLSGQVHAEGGGVVLQSDSLTWDRDEERFILSDGADLEVPRGRLRAATLQGDSDLGDWTATQVRSSFADSASRDSVHIEGGVADLRVAAGRVTARFGDVVGRWGRRRLTAGTARYEGGTGRLGLTEGVVVADSGRRVRADTVAIDLSARTVQARGRVRVEGAVAVAATRLGEDAQRRALATGYPVRVEVDGRSLEARGVVVSSTQDTVLAWGGVALTEGGRRIRADTVRLVRPDSALMARGQVRVVAADVEGGLRAEHLQSAAGGRQVRLWGRPRLRRDRGDGDDLTVQADTLRLDGGAGRLWGRGHFALSAPPHVRLQAARGVYHTTGDRAGLTAGVAFEYLAGDSRSRLQADTCTVVLKGGGPQRVDWPLEVRGRLQDREQVSWLRAGSGSAELVEGRLRRLTLSEHVEVTHRGGQGGRLTRFEAQSMALTFDATGLLRRVHAEGGAVVRARLSTDGGEAAVNEVRGEGLDVELAHGVVVTVGVRADVEGRYTPVEGED